MATPKVSIFGDVAASKLGDEELAALIAEGAVRVQTLLAVVAEAPRDQLPFLAGELEVVRVAIYSRMATPSIELPDERLDVDQAAEMLRVGRDYVYKNWKRLKWPFVEREGSRLFFSRRGLEAHRSKQRRRAKV